MTPHFSWPVILCSLLSCVYTDLKAATNMSANVIWLDPLKVEVKWSHQRIENTPLPSGFMVVAKAGNSISPKIEMVGNPHIHQAALELSHNTTYLLKVITMYGDNTQLESEEMEFTTPTEDEGSCHDIGSKQYVLLCISHIPNCLDFQFNYSMEVEIC